MVTDLSSAVRNRDLIRPVIVHCILVVLVPGYDRSHGCHQYVETTSAQTEGSRVAPSRLHMQVGGPVCSLRRTAIRTHRLLLRRRQTRTLHGCRPHLPMYLLLHF